MPTAAPVSEALASDADADPVLVEDSLADVVVAAATTAETDPLDESEAVAVAVAFEEVPYLYI